MKHAVTPSARARERVTARWPEQKQIDGPSQRGYHWLKLFSGFPIPWILYLLAIILVVDVHVAEIASWVLLACIGIYIFVDRISQQRELRFYRVGGDLALGIFVLATIVGGSLTFSIGEYGWEQLQWVFLIYGLTYMWELFPGLNRWWKLMGWLTVAVVLFGVFQFFNQLHTLNDQLQLSAPVTSSFSSPALLAAWLAGAIPFFAALISHFEEPDTLFEKANFWTLRLLLLLAAIALYGTYQYDLWIAAAMGLLGVTILNFRKGMWQILIPVLAFVLLHQLGLRPLAMDEQNQLLRESMQHHFSVWQNHIWFGDPATQALKENNSYLLLMSRSGIVGTAAYLLFAVGTLLSAYRLYGLIPKGHTAHRAIIAGIFGGLLAIYGCGVYIATLWQMPFAFLFAMMVATLSYMSEHYDRGLVSDDTCL